MSFPSVPRLRFPVLIAAAASFVLALSACASGTVPSTDGHSTSTESSLPSAHVHGLHVDSETGQVLLATHDGLFDVTGERAVKIGATNDLMGFTAGAEQDVYYASGHPGEGSTLPDPLGLTRSGDGGETWEQLSRQGESDFHALTVSKSGIVAFDGKLRTSTDGRTWETVEAGFMPAVLAGNPGSDTVLATTPDGLQRSIDGGSTWVLNESSPVIQYAAFANAEEVIGVEPDGTVHYSSDAGATWSPRGRMPENVLAVAAAEGSGPNLHVWAATGEGLFISTDGGTTFSPREK